MFSQRSVRRLPIQDHVVPLREDITMTLGPMNVSSLHMVDVLEMRTDLSPLMPVRESVNVKLPSLTTEVRILEVL